MKMRLGFKFVIFSTAKWTEHVASRYWRQEKYIQSFEWKLDEDLGVHRTIILKRILRKEGERI
jgi:hypothetical protein